MSYQEQFQPVKYYFSRISTCRNTKLKNCKKFSFLVFSTDFSFALNTYGTLNMFLLSVQTNFCILYWVHMYKSIWKKNLVWGLCLWFVSRSPKSWRFFEKFTVELVLKSFSGRNNSVEAWFWIFYLPYDLEESREFRALISWALA